MTAALPPARRPPRTGRVVLVGALVAVAAVALVAAGLSHRTDDPSAVDRPREIVALLPEPGSVAFRQDDIGADLLPYLTGTLVIDGREIPEDQIDLQDLGTARRVTFRPGVDDAGEPKAIEELEPGRHSVQILWWNEVQGRPGADATGHLGSYRWEFTVQ